MNLQKEKQNRSFLTNYENNNKTNKNKQKRKSNNFSPVRNAFELNSHTSEIKRFGTNELKIDTDYENSEISTNLLNRKKKFKNRKSLKFIEKNIQNRILDISMQIEKEENITSGLNKDLL